VARETIVTVESKLKELAERDKRERAELIKATAAGGNIHAGDGGYEIGDPEKHAAFVTERNKSLMFDYHEAIRRMHEGAVVQYFGTVNGNVFKRGAKFCMQRGVVFLYKEGAAVPATDGSMVYDPDFRFIPTYEKVEPRGWPNK
jgi:hypothetical protein